MSSRWSKAVFFAQAWARHETARPESLCLLPPETRRAELGVDYAKMQEMMFGEAPTFGEIMEKLEAIERRLADRQ